MSQYKWLPTTCAPQCYPVKLMDGAFYFNQNEADVFIPRGNICNNGWGEIGLINLTETETFSIPAQFDVTWFSFTENLFYKGEFNVPEEKTELLFNTGFKHPDTGESVTYEYLITGLAPEGLVCLWAAGHGIVTELATYKAAVVKIEWDKFNDNKNITRQQYIEQRLKSLLKEHDLLWLESNRKKFGLWKKYHQKYNWTPMFLGNIIPVNIRINFFNGEKEFIETASAELQPQKQRSMMQSMVYRWKNTSNKNFVSKIFFSEPEVLAIFKKYNDFDENAAYMLQIELNEEDYTLRLFITNDVCWYEFKNCEIKIFSEKSKDEHE
jgi:hypothetical protein